MSQNLTPWPSVAAREEAPYGSRRQFLIAGLAAAAGPTWASRSASAAAASLQVGFVYVSPIGNAGWSYQHELGRRQLVKELGAKVQTHAVDSVAEGADSERVMRDLAQRGCRLIFATSFGYLEPALRVAADFPQTVFEHAGGYKTAANLNTYNARFYEGRYLAGMLAGKASKSGVAGYVAGFPLPEVIQGINAFAIGMREVNPQAQVKVLWLNNWFDPAREREAALTLVNQGADVLTNHSASPAVPLVAEEKGVRLIAYTSDMAQYAPRAQLAAVTHHWGDYYSAVARRVLAGTWKPEPVWGGMHDGMVRLSALHPQLPKDWRRLVERRQHELVTGRRHPFQARLLDKDGQLRHPGGPMTDADIARMDWFVQGVSASLKS